LNLYPLIRFYESITPESVSRFPEFYAENACFKDPFNEVRGLGAIQRIFAHMFGQVDEPRFVVSEQVADAHGAVLIWTFHYRFRGVGKASAEQVMRGVSHLKFDADGKVVFHRDYWDTAEELYMKIPLLGALMRFLRKRLSVGESDRIR